MQTKTLQLVLGLLAVLCCGIKAQDDTSPCGACGDNQYCNGTMCVCQDGFSGQPCEDVNECDMNVELCAPREVNQCINTQGSYMCNCSAEYGYFFVESIGTCSKDVAVILGLPVEWEATIIAQSDTCSPENTEQQREDINTATLEALRDGLRKLGLLQEGSGN